MSDFLENIYQADDAYSGAEAYKPLIDRLMVNYRMGNTGANPQGLPAGQMPEAASQMKQTPVSLSAQQKKMAFRLPQSSSTDGRPIDFMLSEKMNDVMDAVTGWMNAGADAQYPGAGGLRPENGEGTGSGSQNKRSAGGWRMASDDSVKLDRYPGGDSGTTRRVLGDMFMKKVPTVTEWANKGSAAIDNSRNMDADREWWSFDSKHEKANERVNHLFKLLDEDERKSRMVLPQDERHAYGVPKNAYFSTNDTYSSKMANDLSRILQNEKYGEDGLNLARELQDRFVRTGQPVDGMAIWSGLRDHFGNHRAIEIINEMNYFSGAKGIELPDGRKELMFGPEHRAPNQRPLFR